MELQFGHKGISRAQIIGVLSLFFVSPIPAQGPAPLNTPKEVLQAYRKMDAEGERLTAAGWYRASKFFVKPGQRPQHNVVAVMDGETVEDPDPWFNGGNNRVQIGVFCSALGQIDSSGRFTSLVAPSLMDPSGRPVRQSGPPLMNGPAPLVREYELVLTDSPWEFGPNREGPREVKGPEEWRIEGFQFKPWVTIEAAIRYLTRLRDESSSQIIKKNADKSIATLRRLLQPH